MPSRIFFLLLASYLAYSVYVYTYCDTRFDPPNRYATKGFSVWQEKNCQSCHQIYGLGGYMGPDLTNIASDPVKGTEYAKVFMRYGSAKMPNLKLNDEQINELVSFLKWVDRSGHTKVPASDVTITGNYDIRNIE